MTFVERCFLLGESKVKKSVVLAGVLFQLSAVALADMSDTNEVMKICEDRANLAITVYRMKEEGSQMTKRDMINMLREANGKKYRTRDDLLVKNNEIDADLINYSYDEASDRMDAKRHAWAKCMDVLKIYR